MFLNSFIYIRCSSAIRTILIKDDINACRKVSNTIKNYDSVFWKKANLLCFILQRNISEANFVYDVMRSQNLLDKTFERLIDKIILLSI